MRDGSRRLTSPVRQPAILTATLQERSHAMNMLFLIIGGVSGGIGGILTLRAKKKPTLKAPALFLMILGLGIFGTQYLLGLSSGAGDAKRVETLLNNATGYAAAELVGELPIDPLKVTVFSYGTPEDNRNAGVLESLNALNAERVEFFPVYETFPMGVPAEERRMATQKALNSIVARDTDIYVFLTGFPAECIGLVKSGKKLILLDQKVSDTVKRSPQFHASAVRNPDFEQKNYPKNVNELFRKVFDVTRR